MIRPSPAIVVPADMQIGDAVRRMRDHDVGSVLVVREVLPHDLVGIFTERDLIHKIDEIQHGGYWEKGIASVMTKPVICISVYDLKKAPEVMDGAHIRHLPVVYLDAEEQQHLVGVISMRDLFQDYFRNGGTSSFSQKRERQRRIGLASKDAHSLGMLRTILSQSGRAEIIETDPEKLVEGLDGFLERARPDVLVVDFDFMAPGRWSKFLHDVNHSLRLPHCIVLFSPALHEEKNVQVLHKLESERFAAFAKPINILSFVQRVQETIESQ